MTASLLHRLRFGHTVLPGACLSLSLGVFAAPALADAADQAGGDVVAWLMAPIDPSRAHDVDWITSWHGRLMVLIWCVIFPAGIMAARFFKIMPGQDWPRELDSKRWWRTHLSTQYTGGGLLLLALGLALYATGTGQNGIAGWHQFLGWTVAILAAWQFLGGWLRGSKGGPTDPAPDGSPRGDHYDMTWRRRIFEYAHKAGGYLALLTACIAIITGLHAANAPHWMWLGIGGWGALLITLAVWLQVRGLTRDTYEAIWGPGAEHPGNSLTPIGLGIRRSSNEASADHGD